MNNTPGRKVLRAVAIVWLPSLLTFHAAETSAGGSRWPADERVTFSDIAKKPGSGIRYRRTRSRHDALWAPLRAQPVVPIFAFGSAAPVRSRGVPGVAVLDFDRDGDLDIYVTNGPGSPNSLYSNQLKERGKVRFVDVAARVGVAATAMDSSGVCYGDIDNDGDHDLYVLGLGEPNKLFLNNGRGKFTDVTAKSEVGGRPAYSTACSMGDVNGDGLLDIVVGNTTQSWDNPAFPTDHNELFLNLGHHRFRDVSEASGITQLAGFAPEHAGAAGLTWAIAMVDYDLDGDIDILMCDDQSAYPINEAGGVPGFVHVMRNDGTGHFTDMTVEAGLNINGAWMGMSFGDLDADGYLDMFVTNIGDYMNAEYFPYPFGDRASRWFLGRPDGTFQAQPLEPEDATAFGWGTMMGDYDNDGDTDIVYRGGMDGGVLVDASNPGIIFWNDGQGNMSFDPRSVSGSSVSRRNVQGMAHGDFNRDGFLDLVSVSNFDTPESLALQPYTTRWGAQQDESAYFIPTFSPVGPLQFAWNGLDLPDGTLSIDINEACADNGSVAIELLGTAHILRGGRSNRDGIGATVSFTPRRGKTAMQPVLGGDSYASQNSLTAHFGLGRAPKGTVEILWPGGTRNRLYNVRDGETVRVPEIPCSYDADLNFIEYERCVWRSLDKLENRQLLDRRTSKRLYNSAIRAYAAARNDDRDADGQDEDT